MKKIFAFVLATIMVLSLVPASAFAAITKADCSNGHKDPVKIGGQAATCQSSGYTIYKCNECGESYVADPVEKLEHNWVSDKKNAHRDVAASCLYGTDGYKYVVCGNKGCSAATVLVVHKNSVEAHNLQKVSGMGCETLWSCKTCGAEGHKAPLTFTATYTDTNGEQVTKTFKTVELSDAPAHTWEFAEVIEEPAWNNGEEKTGLARYECATEGCPAFKNVIIDCPDCECAEKVLIQPAIAETCTTNGTLAVYQCVACAALWFDSNADEDDTKVGETDLYKPEYKKNDTANDDDINDDGKITLEDAVIEATGHTEPAANKITQTGCVKSYTCTVCKQAVSVANHINKTENEALKPNCVRYGITYVTCTCGWQETKIVEATGHSKKTYEYVPSTCAVQGGKWLVCNKPDCPMPEYEINGVKARFISVVEAYALNSSNHDLRNTMSADGGKKSPTCTESVINVMVCAYGCAQYATPTVEYLPAKGHTWHTYVTIANCKTGSGTFTTPWTKATFMYCTECKVEYEYNLAAGAPVPTATTDGWEKADITAATAIETTFSSVEAMLEYHGVLAREWSWQKVSGTWKDVDVKVADTKDYHWRKYSKTTWLGADGAFTELPLVSKPATCTEAGYTAYVCNDCGMPAYVTIKKAKHDKLGGTIPGTPATCNTPGVRESYICSVCDTVWAQTKKASGSRVTANDSQTTDLTIKPCGNYEDLVVVTSCNGTKYYKCTKCNTIYKEVACKNKVAPSTVNDCAWKYLVTATPATCGVDGTIGVRYCNTCKQIDAYIVYERNGELEEIPVDPEDGKKYSDNGTREFVLLAAEYDLTTDVVIKVPKNGKASFYYLANVTSSSPVVVKKLEHVLTYDYAHASTNVTDHSEAIFVKEQCSACDYELVVDYIPAAAGHINSDGQVLTVDCENANAVTNRICVICNKVLSKEESTIATGHNMVPATDKTAADWDCTNAGFSYNVCTKCGAFEVGDTVIPADADAYHAQLLANPGFNLYVAKTIKAVGPIADYAHDGAYYYACATCGAQLTEYEEEDCPGVGVEFTLDADYASYSFGSSIFVTVNIDSLKGVEVWGLNFQVGYTDNVKFIGFKTIDASGFTGTAHSPVEAYLENNGTISYKSSGVVNVALSNANGIIVKGESSVIVLEFQVIKNAEGRKMAADFTIGNLDDGTSVLSAVVVGANRKNIACMYNDVASERVEVKAFADLDGDNATTMFDAFDLYYLILNDGYDVVADIDKNGLVNVDDLNILYDFIIGKIGADDILNPKEEEAKERVIEKDAEGNVIYDSLCDFNENGKIDTVSELAALSGRIDPNLFW